MYDSVIKVNLSVTMNIETEQHPRIVQYLRKILADNAADIISKYSPEDLNQALVNYEIISTENDDVQQYENDTILCAHRIKYRFWGDKIPEDLHSALDEEAERRAQEMLTENYQSGELHYEDGDVELRGWWEINRD